MDTRHERARHASTCVSNPSACLMGRWAPAADRFDWREAARSAPVAIRFTRLALRVVAASFPCAPLAAPRARALPPFARLTALPAVLATRSGCVALLNEGSAALCARLTIHFSDRLLGSDAWPFYLPHRRFRSGDWRDGSRYRPFHGSERRFEMSVWRFCVHACPRGVQDWQFDLRHWPCGLRASRVRVAPVIRSAPG